MIHGSSKYWQQRNKSIKLKELERVPLLSSVLLLFVSDQEREIGERMCVSVSELTCEERLYYTTGKECVGMSILVGPV